MIFGIQSKFHIEIDKKKKKEYKIAWLFKTKTSIKQLPFNIKFDKNLLLFED